MWCGVVWSAVRGTSNKPGVLAVVTVAVVVDLPETVVAVAVPETVVAVAVEHDV